MPREHALRRICAIADEFRTTPTVLDDEGQTGRGLVVPADAQSQRALMDTSDGLPPLELGKRPSSFGSGGFQV
jgi:hypothetical protein